MSVTLPTSPAGNDLGGTPFGVIGAEYNGNQYLFVQQGAAFEVGDQKIHILKSGNLGISWTDIAQIAVTPAGLPTVLNPGYTICQDGSLVYILYLDMTGVNSGAWTVPSQASTGSLYLRTLDLTSDTLSAESVTGFTVYKHNSGSHATTNLVRRGSGDMLFVYSSIPELISSNFYFRVSVATFDGASFGTPSLVPGQSGNVVTYLQHCAGVDDGGILHVIFSGTDLLHSGLDGVSFGSTSTIDSPTGYTGRTSRLATYSGSIAFVSSHATDDKTIYHASSGIVNPSWSTHIITTFTPVVDNAVINESSPFALAYLNGNLHLFWTRSGSVDDGWAANTGQGVIQHSQASIGNLSSWSGEDTIVANPGPSGNLWAAAQVSVYEGSAIGLGVFAGFTGYTDPGGDPIENSQFLAIPAETPAAVTRLVADAFPGLGDTIIVNFIGPLPPIDTNDAISLVDGQPQLGLTVISNPGDNIVPPPPGTGTPAPNVPPIAGMGNCIFEFYEMQKPEDVEVLPVPKRFDQLGPMRFDKIGKIFALRIRLIMNGTTTSLPFAIYGDDSETSPHLNSPLYSDSFTVRPGFDNVYEIQLPKSVNTDIFRLTLGPVADSFHRYNVIVKVHISGMQGQAKWLPIR